MTFNIRHAKGLDDRVDLERVIAVIRSVDADVVALQEVDRYQRRSGYVDQVAVIGSALGMRWCYAASIRKGFSEYGNAILSRCMAPGNEVIFIPGEIERRSLLRAQLAAEAGLLLVLTTHLGVSDRDRSGQFPLLIQQLKTIDRPAVLMGDFNTEADHPRMSALQQHGWYRAQLKEGESTIAGGGVIDHIFSNTVRPGFAARTIATNASDHCPVVAEICRNMVHYDHIDHTNLQRMDR